MKRFLVYCLVAVLFLGLAAPGTSFNGTIARAQSTPQTYTVLVGAEDLGLKTEVMKYFPSTLQIHVGDTVTWQINSMEMHTVTFLAPGDTLPAFVVPAPDGQPSPVMINPQLAFPIAPTNGLYDGTTYANSGIMGQEQGQAKTFSLTFTKAGTFTYVCGVHGVTMSATIEVVDTTTSIPSPQDALNQGLHEIAAEKAQIPHIVQQARAQITQLPQPDWSSTGPITFTVDIGYSSNEFDVMDFFPNHLTVRPGDTIVYQLSKADIAPHTVTFLNGNADIPILTVVPQPGSQPLLLLNPEVLDPAPIPATDLTNTGVFNSGFMDPTNPSTPHSYSIKIGDITGEEPYICILHDTMGMGGSLTIAPSTTTVANLKTLNTIPAWFTSGGYIEFLPNVSVH
jgi:plastocyanin